MIFVVYFLFTLPLLYFFYHVLTYFQTKVPIVKTPKKYYQELFNNFPIPKNSVIYELGCGRGDFLFQVEKFFPKKLVGVEMAFLHILYAKIKAKIKKSKIEFLRQNFFAINLSDADIVYLFLVEPIVVQIWDKIKKETKPGTIVIVLSDKIKTEKAFLKIPTKPKNKNTTYYRLYRT